MLKIKVPKGRTGLAFVARTLKTGGGVHKNKAKEKQRNICREKINPKDY